MSGQGYIGLPSVGATIREITEVVNGILFGNLNAVTSVTLTANVTTTTLTDNRLTPNSFVGLMPRTANAATALATTYILAADLTKGSAVITHANTATTDRTFTVLIIG